jgi:hypothetical protein
MKTAQKSRLNNGDVEDFNEGRELPKDKRPVIHIKEPDIRTAVFEIIGTAPLVVHRFSAKTKNQMKMDMEEGKSSSSKKRREAVSTDDLFNAARYQSKEGWDGFHAGSIRLAMINACRLIDYKMTLAKMSLFVIQDGWDMFEPQIPLIRIYGQPVKQEDMARVATGGPYVTVRAAYHDWKAKLNIRWDNDQFSITDVSRLLHRAGTQVGLCEGRPFSKNSAGMGWGTFEIRGRK